MLHTKITFKAWTRLQRNVVSIQKPWKCKLLQGQDAPVQGINDNSINDGVRSFVKGVSHILKCQMLTNATYDLNPDLP